MCDRESADIIRLQRVAARRQRNYVFHSTGGMSML